MSTKTVVVCVLGLSRETGHSFQTGVGVGKSCLCYRFMHPGFDDYISEHPSILALHEFESSAINNVHFVYWGSNKQAYSSRGKERSVVIHVVEHTVFYQDVTSQPFTILTKPDDVGSYARRAMAHIESPGKVSYRTRDALCLDIYPTERYPHKISGMTRGFIVVVDVSMEGARFDAQLARAEKICQTLVKGSRKFILVASKRESCAPSSLERLYQLKRKYRTIVVETSASCNYNIAVAFRAIAGMILHESKLQDDIPTFGQAAENLLLGKASAKRLFSGFLSNRIQASSERISHLENTEQYKACQQAVGKFTTDKMIALKLLEVRNHEIQSYSGVKESSDLRLEFLEEYLDLRSDLMLYEKDLKRKIQDYVQECPDSPPTSERSSRHSPSSERLQSQPSEGSATNLAGGEVREGEEEEVENSFESVSDGEDEANLYINFVPGQPVAMLPETTPTQPQPAAPPGSTDNISSGESSPAHLPSKVETEEVETSAHPSPTRQGRPSPYEIHSFPRETVPQNSLTPQVTESREVSQHLAVSSSETAGGGSELEDRMYDEIHLDFERDKGGEGRGGEEGDAVRREGGEVEYYEVGGEGGGGGRGGGGGEPVRVKEGGEEKEKEEAVQYDSLVGEGVLVTLVTSGVPQEGPMDETPLASSRPPESPVSPSAVTEAPPKTKPKPKPLPPPKPQRQKPQLWKHPPMGRNAGEGEREKDVKGEEGFRPQSAGSISTTAVCNGGQGSPDQDRSKQPFSGKSVSFELEAPAPQHQEDFEPVTSPPFSTASYDVSRDKSPDVSHEPLLSPLDMVQIPMQPSPALRKATPSPPPGLSLPPEEEVQYVPKLPQIRAMVDRKRREEAAVQTQEEVEKGNGKEGEEGFPGQPERTEEPQRQSQHNGVARSRPRRPAPPPPSPPQQQQQQRQPKLAMEPKQTVGQVDVSSAEKKDGGSLESGPTAPSEQLYLNCLRRPPELLKKSRSVALSSLSRIGDHSTPDDAHPPKSSLPAPAQPLENAISVRSPSPPPLPPGHPILDNISKEKPDSPHEQSPADSSQPEEGESSSIDERSESPPPEIPKHTKASLQLVGDPSSPKRKVGFKKLYEHVKIGKKLSKSYSDEFKKKTRVTKDMNSSPSRQAAVQAPPKKHKKVVKSKSTPRQSKPVAAQRTVVRSNPPKKEPFIVMKYRPLPQLPFTVGEDDDDFHEVDDYDNVGDIPAMLSTYRGGIVPPQSVTQSLPPDLLLQRQDHPNPAMERRSQSLGVPHSDSVDKDYENEDEFPLPGLSSHREGSAPSQGARGRPPPTPSRPQLQKQTSESEQFEYDYPDMHIFGFRTLPPRFNAGHFRPPRTIMVPPSGMKLPPRNLTRPLLRGDSTEGDEYVHMTSAARDDNYINWETINSQRPGSNPMVRRHSMEDLKVYINLPLPQTTPLPPRAEKGPQGPSSSRSLQTSSPQRTQCILPPRNVPRDPEQQQGTLLETPSQSSEPRKTLLDRVPMQTLTSSQPTLTQRATPPVSPRPKPRKQRAAASEVPPSPPSGKISPSVSLQPSPHHTPHFPHTSRHHSPKHSQKLSTMAALLASNSDTTGDYYNVVSDSVSPQPSPHHTPHFPHTSRHHSPKHSQKLSAMAALLASDSDTTGDYYNVVSDSFYKAESPSHQMSVSLPARPSSSSYLDVVP